MIRLCIGRHALRLPFVYSIKTKVYSQSGNKPGIGTGVVTSLYNVVPY